MPISLTWQPRLAVLVASGDVTADELARAGVGVTCDPRHRADTAVLLDLRAANLAGLGAEQLKRLKIHAAALPSRHGGRTALLVGPHRAADYGKARWWTGLVAGADGASRQVFVDEDEALSWLGVLVPARV
jgi:hypothetical protein